MWFYRILAIVYHWFYRINAMVVKQEVKATECMYALVRSMFQWISICFVQTLAMYPLLKWTIYLACMLIAKFCGSKFWKQQFESNCLNWVRSRLEMYNYLYPCTLLLGNCLKRYKYLVNACRSNSSVPQGGINFNVVPSVKDRHEQHSYVSPRWWVYQIVIFPTYFEVSHSISFA